MTERAEAHRSVPSAGTRERTPRERTQRRIAVREGAFVFAGPHEITPGAVLYDRGDDMPGRVRERDGLYIYLERPTGRVWRVHYQRLRPATRWEHRQLTAIGRLHRDRLKGMTWTASSART
ncbi:hypothetical protein ACPXCE_07410 [Streptomyces sp. DT24]|uniref:hypothetical protein n=1 Tax=unclassified Streptomyces TaxID=2593676 RepID=UPI0023B8D79C|nr:hypothetical protein [Streptomyces sp. AM 4-1-1]WEH33298.1 hypothetical protein PZB75_07840 [Streptomyces sp. AM 4-1-1]